MSTLRALMASLDADLGDNLCPRALADHLYEQLGDRMAALRIVAALRRVARRRNCVPRAVALLGPGNGLNAPTLRSLVSLAATGRDAYTVTICVCPGSRRPAPLTLFDLRVAPVDWVVICPVRDTPRFPSRIGDTRAVVVGASWVIRAASLFPSLPQPS